MWRIVGRAPAAHNRVRSAFVALSLPLVYHVGDDLERRLLPLGHSA